MSVQAVHCPHCQTALKLPATVPAGKKIKCPKCASIFATNTPPEPSAPTAFQPRPAAVPPVPAQPIPVLKPVKNVNTRNSQQAPRRRPRQADASADKPDQQGNPVLLIGLIGGGVALLLVAGISIAFIVWFFQEPATLGGPVAVGPAVPAAAPQPVAVNDPAPPAFAGNDTIPLQTLQAIKNATAFIKMEAGNQGGTGSGFLMKVDGTTAYLVTNHHVITPPKQEQAVVIGRIQPRVVKAPAIKPTITAVLWSGTPREQEIPAEVAASDEDRDLAILKISGVANLPAPIDISQRPQLVETMPLYIFGYPFGKALATNKRSPAITVGKGSVSSLRLDDRGELTLVQINGDLNPGNSGGPVVDAQGRLVGVSVATIRGTQIGLAIPSLDLTNMLEGRILGSLLFQKKISGANADVYGEVWVFDRHNKILANRGVHVRLTDVTTGSGDFEIESKLIDPLGRLQGVALFHAAATATTISKMPNAQGLWAPIPGAQRLDLKLEGQRALGTLDMLQTDPANDTHVFQMAYIRGDGQIIYAQPHSFRLPSASTVVASNPATTPLGLPSPANPFAGLPTLGQPFGGLPPLPGTPPATTSDHTVILRITGVIRPSARQNILNKLSGLTDGKDGTMRSSNFGSTLTVQLSPVRDPQTLARRIDFGRVISIQGRTILVMAHPQMGMPSIGSPFNR